ncbi:MAG: hypothetical protein Crog4KO_18730 [Crocinitomicaceae bacterium]
MQHINSTEIQNWAEKSSSKSILPLLIRKLIRATIDSREISTIDFPALDDVQVGGYDGQLAVTASNAYVTDGQSVWEFGSNKKKKNKADEDYEKRTNDPLGKAPKETVYIGLTAYKWASKKKWVEARNKEGIWKEVRFYDATDLEHWLDLAPVVRVWFAKVLGKPIDGIFHVEDYWKAWSVSGNLHIPTELLVSSRKSESDKLRNFLLSETNTLTYIKSNTKDESLAFVMAHALNLEEDESNAILSRTLVIANRENFSELIEQNNSLILVFLFTEDTVDINRAISKGHKVILPVSNSFDQDESNTINLSIPDKEEFSKVLQIMGYDSIVSRSLAEQSSRNVSVLKRILKIERIKPDWFSNDHTESLIPVILLPRFNSANSNDRAIIEELSGISYSQYESFLRKLLFGEESPLFNIGDNWRVVSHTDMWIHLARFVSKGHLESYRTIAKKILSEQDPRLDLEPNERMFANLRGVEKPLYSGALKKGVCETLVILSVLSKDYGLNCTPDPEGYVDSIVMDVLGDNSTKVWKSLGRNLLLLAEASPKGYLKGLEKLLLNGEVQGFFELQKGWFSSHIDLTEVLWGLDVTSWVTDYLLDTSRLLCELIKQGPEEYPTANTPIASLKSIFSSWFPQTNASLEERLGVLQYLSKNYPDIAFDLYYDLIFDGRGSAFHKPRMKWRLFSELREVKSTNHEVHTTNVFFLESLLDYVEQKKSKNNLLRVIKKFDDFSNWGKLDRAMSVVSSFESSEEEKNEIYHELRGLVGHHRSYPSANWSMEEANLKRLEELAQKFEPTDLFERESYLFEDNVPMSFEGNNDKKDWREEQNEAEEKRKQLLVLFLDEYGLEKIIEYAKLSDKAYLYGQALGQLDTLTETDEQLILSLLDEDDNSAQLIAKNYIWSKEKSVGREAIISLFEKLQENNLSDKAAAKYLLGMSSDLSLFEYVDSLKNNDVDRLFWEGQFYIVPREEGALKFAVSKFLLHKLYLLAIETLGHSRKLEELSTEFITSTLESVDVSGSNENPQRRIDPYNFRSIFEELHSREDVDSEKVALLEYKYVFIFDSIGGGLKPKFLYEDVAQNPSTFIELIKGLYIPQDDTLRSTELEALTSEQIELRGRYADQVLRNCNIIPGSNNDSINEEQLGKWIEEVRKLSVENSRAGVTDSSIGQLLSRYKGKSGVDFPDEIFNVLEQINSDRMLRGFSMELFNNMGVTVRASGAGGDIERERSKMHKDVYDRIRFSHPNVAKIYKDRADEYLYDAEMNDQSALRGSLD